MTENKQNMRKAAVNKRKKRVKSCNPKVELKRYSMHIIHNKTWFCVCYNFFVCVFISLLLCSSFRMTSANGYFSLCSTLNRKLESCDAKLLTSLCTFQLFVVVSVCVNEYANQASHKRMHDIAFTTIFGLEHFIVLCE